MKKAINHGLMRSSNKRQILDFMQKQPKVSKKQLAEALGLSLTSVSTFISELLREGKIISNGRADSTGGRRSILYQVNPDSYYFIGIDLQVDRLIGVILNFRGDLVGEEEVPFEDQDAGKLIPVVNRFLTEFRLKRGIPEEKIGGIGIGVPGVVNGASGLVEFAPNLGWREVDLGSQISLNKLLIVENEANAAAVGERRFGAAQNVSDIIYVSVGMGIGCGIIIESRLYPGFSFQAGEFGHMTVEMDGRLCRCGNRGCWEAYSSDQAALNFFSEKAGWKVKRIEEFLAEVGLKNPSALEVLGLVVKYLGVGISSIINGLNPQMVVIGGKIVEVKSLIAEELEKAIRGRVLKKDSSGLELKFSILNNRASAMGVAGMAIDRIISMIG